MEVWFVTYSLCMEYVGSAFLNPAKIFVLVVPLNT